MAKKFVLSLEFCLKAIRQGTFCVSRHARTFPKAAENDDVLRRADFILCKKDIGEIAELIKGKKLTAGMLPKKVGTQKGLTYPEKHSYQTKQMQTLQAQGQCRDPNVLLLFNVHRSKGAQRGLCLCQIDIGILKSQMRQFVVNMQDGDAPPFQLQAEECIFVSVLVQVFVEADREKQTATDEEVECRELCVREALPLGERQPFFCRHLIVITETGLWTRALGEIACAATNHIVR